LIVRVDGIGDALCLVPLLCALRDAGHELGALLSTQNAQIFAPGVFVRTHVLERIPWPAHGSTLETYKIARTQARLAGYDVALIASEEPEAYRFAKEAGVAIRVGFVNGWEKPLKSLATRRLLTRSIVRPASARRAVEHEVETLFRLGDGWHDEPAATRDVRRLRRALVEDETECRRDDRVALQIVPKAFARPKEGFAEIARTIATAYPVVVVGSSADRDIVHAAALAADAPALVFERVADWRDALLGMRAIVTPDSGAAHLAGMAGIPCVDLFPARRDVVLQTMRWAPWAAPSRTLIVGPEPSGNGRAVLAALRDVLDGDAR
jgi:ADP-heptose:LPS heptosyltransferase